MKILATVFLLLFCTVNSAYAFLPPQFFVQGLSSLWTVMATGVAVAIIPLVISLHFLKGFYKKHRKIILLILAQNVIVAIALGIFFYARFYKPLYEDSYLFAPRLLDPSQFNKKYKVVDGMLRDTDDDVDDIRYGLMPQQVKEIMEKGKKAYFIDTREIEEFNAGHIVGARHVRYKDLRNEDDLLRTFSLNKDDFPNSFFVLYCHNGDRASFTAREFNKENIKYLIGGAEGLYGSDTLKYTGSWLSDKAIFEKKYQHKFQSTAQEAIKIMKKKPFMIVDMRRSLDYGLRHIKGSFSFPLNLLTQEEYNRILSDILACKGREFILVADRYSELFYANLLILRLSRDYSFDENKFHIVFHQLSSFESDPFIEWEGSFVKQPQ